MNELERRRSGLEQLAEAIRQIGEIFGPQEPRPVQAHAERVDRQQLLNRPEAYDTTNARKAEQ